MSEGDLEPVTRFPGDRSHQLWSQRVKAPLATFRCGRGKRRCDRLAYVYGTPLGETVVVFFQNTPDRPASLDLPAEGLPDEYEPPSSYKKFDPEARTALLRGRKDERGTAVALEDDHHWSNVVEVGCMHHLDLLPLSRAQLMDAARRARDTGRHVEVLMTRH